MPHTARTPLQPLHNEVSISRTIQRVLSDALEPELLGQKVSVDAEGVSGERATAQGEDGDAGEEGGETGEVGGEGEGVREKEMGPANGLGSLRMRGGGAEGEERGRREIS
jgi:hypothetical protein